MSGIAWLKAGYFNLVGQEPGPDDSVIITLTKRGESIGYRFAVKDLYGPDELVLWEEVIGD